MYSNLSPDDLEKIVDAIAKTPQFQFLTEMMEREQNQPAPGAEDDLGLDIDEEEPVDDEDVSEIEDLLGPEEEDEPEMTPPGGDEMPAGPPPGEPEDEELEPEEKLSMATYQQDNAYNDATVERSTKLQASHDRLLKDAAKMHDRIGQLERTNSDNARRRKLESLASEYPGIVEVDDECKVSLYSLGADMTDDQFDKHLAIVEKYAQKAAKANVYIPTGEAEQTEDTAGPEKYAQMQELSRRAVKIATQRRNKGESIDYDEAMEIARQELSK